ncbi:hypothetical protein [Tumebacillus flagellatus]|uniref:Uncharacterized protein n=1 Tax=Tumebacillus flagellatus TaxID=1157490 RepID=A0A074LNW7_9BACL|nr:hypothetical protein [Tumebacillus flagellatus]KEO82175.1 hypothetical protein EL26_16695 [Tumebacillus flagellatus]
MTHEQVLKAFYARLKNVSTESVVRVVDLAREHHMSYRHLSRLLKSSGLNLLWINGKAFVYRGEAVQVLAS